MRIIYFYLISLSVLFSGISFAYAAGGNAAATGVPSAGTVVVAAMESVGYHAQNQILTSLNSMLGDLGGLIYLCVLVSVVLTTALMGRYQAVLWLLIGPPIFIYASGVELGGLKNRISARGPDWQMGAFRGPEGVKEKVMGRVDSPTDVSFLFHKYNELISEVYQLLIDKITSHDARKAVLFMARQRFVEDMFSFDLDTPGGKALGAYFFASCSNHISYAKILGTGKRNPNYKATSIYKNAEKKYCEGFPVKNINLGNENIILSDYAKDLDPPYVLGENVSCLQLWNWFRQTATRDFAAQAENTKNTVFGVEAAADVSAKLENDVREKVTQPEQNVEPDPCPFVSNSATFTVEASESMKVLANIFSALLIRKNNTIDANATGFMSVMGGDMSGIYPSSDGSSKRHVVSLQGRESFIRSQNAKVMATAKQFEAFTALMLIPYFQGMILYVLAVSYPFFALTILVPGQASSFFNWLALWAWAKSWDVGFAMIMVVDQLLWEILPKVSFFETKEIGNYTPVDLLEMHYSGDHSYSLSMYWLIVSMLIGAVPIVTAEAILGSKKAVAGAIMGGLTDISGRLSKIAEDAYSQKAVTQIGIHRTQGEAQKAIEANAKANSGMMGLDKKAEGSDHKSSDAYSGSMEQAQSLFNAAYSGAAAAWNSITGSSNNSPNTENTPGETNKRAEEGTQRNRDAAGKASPEK